MADVQLTGHATVRLVQALARAKVTPFDNWDWGSWCGAEGDACMVVLHKEDDDYFRVQLGIEHWPREVTTLILDNNGLTWNGSGVMNSYAHQVCVGVSVTCHEPGTPGEIWEINDRMLPGDMALERQIAQLPEAVRQTVMACPEEARDYVVRGYLQSAEAVL